MRGFAADLCGSRHLSDIERPRERLASREELGQLIARILERAFGLLSTLAIRIQGVQHVMPLPLSLLLGLGKCQGC